jgi:WD40 repeat protein
VRIWEAATAKEIAALRGHAGRVLSAAFSPDGKRIVTASADKTARLWDGETGKPIGELSGHVNAVLSAAFSPDGKRIVTASADKTARLWDETGKPIGEPLLGHDDAVLSAAFSPDGTRIVTASADGTARLWVGDTGRLIDVQARLEGPVRSALFSPDGTKVLTASLDAAQIWMLAGGRPTVLGLAAAPSGRMWIVGQDGYVATSNDDGAHWQRIESIQTSNDLDSVALPGSTSVILVGNAGAALFSNDEGTTWTRLDLPGLAARGLRDVFFVDDQRGWIAGDDGLIFWTGDGGKPGTSLTRPLGSTSRLFAYKATILAGLRPRCLEASNLSCSMQSRRRSQTRGAYCRTI